MRLTRRGHAAATTLTAAVLFTGLVAAGTLERNGTTTERDTVSQGDPRITEDDVRWNCLTMGNRVCGPDYVALPADKYVPIFGRNVDRWPGYCLWNVDSTTVVVCSDGTVVTS